MTAQLAADLRSTIPQSPSAYSDPRASWLAQRIVGVAATLDSQEALPPELPADYGPLGDAWAAAAAHWTAIANHLEQTAPIEAQGVVTALRHLAASQTT